MNELNIQICFKNKLKNLLFYNIIYVYICIKKKYFVIFIKNRKSGFTV